MNIPGELKKGNRTYIYQERINNNMCLYKEKEFGWNECFLIQDLIKIQDIKKKNKEEESKFMEDDRNE